MADQRVSVLIGASYMEWCRLYAEWGTDPKVQSMSEQMRCRHVMLLSLRCAANVTALRTEELLFYFRITEEELKETKELFMQKGFIDKNWNILKWDKRQTYISSSAKRMRKMRQQKKRALRNGDVTVAQRVARNRREENRTEEKRDPPPPNSTTLLSPLGAEYEAPKRLCRELTGGDTWDAWVDTQGRLGSKAQDIESAVRKYAGGSKFSQQYLGVVLDGWRRGDGAPPGNSNGASVVKDYKLGTPEERAAAEEIARRAIS